ncbi:MAG: pseudouridine synthase [Treponema sp.]
MAEYTIEENDSERRVDRLLRRFLSDAPLPLIYSSIRKGLVKINGKKTRAEKKTSLGDVLYIDESLEALKKKDESFNLDKNNLDVILKTDALLFINKKKGFVTHGKGSIDEEVKKSFSKGPSLSFSIGALHRLDKNTTGVLTFSQSLKGASLFSKAILEGDVERYYIGVNEGKIKEGIWKLPSKKHEEKEKLEITHSKLLEYSKKENLSLSFYKLITGRKHQIRRGAGLFLTPLFCDEVYGSKKKNYSTYFLHSICLHFKKIIFDDIPPFIMATIPRDFLDLIRVYFPNIYGDLNEKGIEEATKIWIKNFFD